MDYYKVWLKYTFKLLKINFRGGGEIHLKKSASEKTSFVIIAKPWRDAKADSGVRVKVNEIYEKMKIKFSNSKSKYISL